ncbi:hypothetical protein CBR_g4467 [Chara braunii]|uniref:Uncharacterized protein n=1 Tax=Chara braunii TaxID=69332 RepID=A0A388KHZ8_CHABU|nr:hypothetical protein CBR_g4467 [Chara braunii]|eukprot:GBG69637.1 hypothetical protein CBR_g4467 [Chara braunii]
MTHRAVFPSSFFPSIIRIFDVKHQKEMGCLVQHEGSVMSVELFGVGTHPTHLVSGGEDGWLCVWDAENWMHLKTLKGHKKAINDLTIHPSGRLALSVSKDRHLRMWNLLKGSCTLNLRLKSDTELIAFTPQKGNDYNLVSGNTITVYNAEDGLLITGSDDGVLRVWNSAEASCVATIPKAHSNRIRGVGLVGASGSLCAADGGLSMPFFVGSASSDGFIKLWDMRKLGGDAADEQEPVCKVQTNARLTCLTSTGSRHGAKTVQLAGSEKEERPTAAGKLDEGQKLESEVRHDASVPIKSCGRSPDEGGESSEENTDDEEMEGTKRPSGTKQAGLKDEVKVHHRQGGRKKLHELGKAKGGAGLGIAKGGQIKKASKGSTTGLKGILKHSGKGSTKKAKRKHVKMAQ